MVWIKNWPFFYLFLGTMGQENLFSDILERKNAFLDSKNKNFKKSKNWDFSKGLTHGFGEKFAIFPSFLFRQLIGQENVFSDILERENAFQDSKNKIFKKSKNWDFFKGVNPFFWRKIGHFFIFFLGNIGQENVFYDILERKNAFLDFKNKKLKKSKNWDFLKGVNQDRMS